VVLSRCAASTSDVSNDGLAAAGYEKQIIQRTSTHRTYHFLIAFARLSPNKLSIWTPIT
jgi:hypothetical protein